jgi:hypothetical protein
MRITESLLRKLIREMAYAGSLGVKRGAPSSGPGILDSDVEKEVAMARAEKFAKSKLFDTQAVKLFGNVPIPVWYAAIIGGVDAGMNTTDAPEDYVYPASDQFNSMMVSDRVGLADTFPEGIEALDAAGFENLEVIKQKDLVIIGVSSMVYPGFNSTPWITLHSFFDADYSEGAYAELCPSYLPLFSIMSMDSDEPLMGISAESYRRFFGVPGLPGYPAQPFFTMGAGRAEKGVSGRDALAECMVQEILDKRRLRLDWDSIPDELIPAGEAVTAIVKAAAEEFIVRARGKTLVAIVN